jgi:hypothetical protein
MTRGRPPRKGLDAAIPIAQERGRVMEFRQTPETPCAFLIAGNGCLALVRVRKARRLHGTVAEIEEEFSDAVREARTIPCGGPVSREIWLYSRYCVMRFFRVGSTGLTELDRHGLPPGPVPAAPGETKATLVQEPAGRSI